MKSSWLLAAVLSAGLTPLPAAAATPRSTCFGMIATTQGPPTDDAPTFQRLYEQQRHQYADQPIGIRLFSAGALPLPGDNSMAGRLLDWAAAAHPDETITVSHKTRSDARLPKLLDWAQAHHLRLSIIYFHEVQDDWARHRESPAEPSAYRDTYRAYRRIIQAHKAGAQVTLEKNLMWYWQHFEAAEHGGDWHDYVERNDPADLISWDTYVFPGMPTAQGRYATADEFFRHARDVWQYTGRPWAVGEIGTTVQDGAGPGAEKNWDPDATKFAAWVRMITTAARNPAGIGSTYAGMPPALFMKWWAGFDQNGTDHRLDQSPAAVTTYRELIKAAPCGPTAG